MARDGSAPPADFVAFVARRAPGVRLAALALTGNDRLAESFAGDLFSAVALRWPRLRHTGDESAGGGADAYLDRIFEREAAAWRRESADPGAPAVDLSLLRRAEYGPDAARLPGPPPAQLAAAAWGSARRTRRWGYLALGVAAVLLAGVLVPREQPAAPEPAVTPPPAAELPRWVDVLPPPADWAGLPQRQTVLPAVVDLGSAARLSQRPARRALALFVLSDRAPRILADDGGVRELDDPLLADIGLVARAGPTTTRVALAPNGEWAAFPDGTGILVADLRTGPVRRFSFRFRVSGAVWLGPRALLVGGSRGAALLDVGTGVATETTVDARHALTDHGRSTGTAAPVGPPASTASPAGPVGLPASLAAQVAELLPAGDPATAPARVRRYQRSGPDAVVPVVTTISGDWTGWIGPWTGPGFRHNGLAARDCDAQKLTLPSESTAVSASVVVDLATGTVRRALAAGPEAVTEGRPAVLGWLDPGTLLIGAGQWLLSWRLADGQLRRVAHLTARALVSVARLGSP
ncbi:MAG TPA: hypothetical protein VFB84_20435 [Micromonosporaceae bacterium]|nr:hypothetical protein [Micromonosporaceae bacterium]